MKETLEKLWMEYLSEECCIIDTDEERELTKKTADLHQKANGLLNKEQAEAVDNYADALCEMEAFYVKKAFVKGCEFAVSFLLEAGRFGK
jgi:alpha-galactosidase